MATIITGLFKDRSSAEQAYAFVVERGYDSKDISVAMSNETRERDFPDFQTDSSANTELESKVAEDVDAPGRERAELGGPVGGTVGTLAPAIAGLGVLLLIPGFGFVVGGPIAAALVAAGTVGVAGSIIGVLTDWGIPADRMRRYETGIRDGGIFIGLKPRSPEDARAIGTRWVELGGEHVHF